MTRVVIDTSVLIRYLIKPSSSIRHLIENMWFGDEITVVSSPELLAELEDVLGREAIRKFIHSEEGPALLDAIQTRSEVLPPLGEVPVYTRDPKDDKFVACAIAGGAAYIITEDRDILTLERLGSILVLTPYHFVKRMGGN